jgi:5S rRNA maturation endonuclease (ribonuclease M5)
MNSYQAKKIPIQDVLASLGHNPIRKDKGGVEWVYNSPFRNEKEPSLFVNVKKNVWNDFGDIGGNVLDLVMRIQNTDFRGALEFMDRGFEKTAFKAHTATKGETASKPSNDKETFILDAVLPLKSRVLENYLRERSINVSIAKNYLKTVQFHHAETGSKYFGLGLENQSGDYEIKNEHLKTVVGKKDISLLHGKGGVGASKEVAIFESAIDFLSYLSDQNKRQLSNDVIILNSTQLADRAKSLIEKKDYQKVYTFLDNDRAGEKAGEILQTLENQIVSCNHLYQGFKDYNEYWQDKKAKDLFK